MAASSTLRPPNRSPTQPDAGIATASVTRYAVTTPLTEPIGTAKYLLSVGSATLTTVASMMFMNIAATNTALTTTFWLTCRTGRENVTNYYKSADVRIFPRNGPRRGSHAPRACDCPALCWRRAVRSRARRAPSRASACAGRSWRAGAGR